MYQGVMLSQDGITLSILMIHHMQRMLHAIKTLPQVQKHIRQSLTQRHMHRHDIIGHAGG